MEKNAFRFNQDLDSSWRTKTETGGKKTIGRIGVLPRARKVDNLRLNNFHLMWKPVNPQDPAGLGRRQRKQSTRIESEPESTSTVAFLQIRKPLSSSMPRLISSFFHCFRCRLKRGVFKSRGGTHRFDFSIANAPFAPLLQNSNADWSRHRTHPVEPYRPLVETVLAHDPRIVDSSGREAKSTNLRCVGYERPRKRTTSKVDLPWNTCASCLAFLALT